MTLYGEDSYNDRVSMLIKITVNFRPTVNTSITDLRGNFVAIEPSYFQIHGNLFIDENMDSLSVTASLSNGTNWPSWLSFSSDVTSTNSLYDFTGTYPTYHSGTVDLILSAQDEYGLIQTVEVKIVIEATCHSTCLDCFGPAIDQCTS